METTVIKNSLKTIGKGIVLVLAFLFIIRECTSCGGDAELTKTDNSQYFAKMKADSIKSLENDKKILVLEAKLVVKERAEDSLVKLAYSIQKKADKSAKTVRDLIKNGICDTVKVLIALNDCDSVKQADNMALASKDSTNKVLRDENTTLKEDNVLQKGMVSSAKTIIASQDEDYKSLDKVLKKTKRRNKIKTVLIIIADVIKDGLIIFAMK